MKIGICIDCKKNAENCGNFEESCGKVAGICKELPLIAGRCQYHYKIYRQSVCSAKKKSKEVSKSLTAPKADLNLVYWYQQRMRECNGRCAECGERISTFDRHSSIAHVLPKRKEHGFPSVATHPLNSIELGPRCGCHNKYDLSWLSASKMKIFPQAIQIATQLYDLLTQEEKARFPDVFEKHINA